MRRTYGGTAGITRVKVCGVNRPSDAEAIADCGAHAIGIILVPESPRFLGQRWSVAWAIREAIGPLVHLVAVVQRLREVEDLPDGLFDAIQYYDDAEYGSVPAGLRRIRTVRVRSEGSADFSSRGEDALLLDTYDPARLGGSGRPFDWHAAGRPDLEGRKLIVAGGLNPDNVGEAIRALRPYAVDVSSGVEASPGCKDMALVRRFMQAVHDADAAMACEAAA